MLYLLYLKLTKTLKTMLKEREKVIEKGSVVFQTLLSFVCFHIAIFISQKYIGNVHKNINEYKNVSYLIIPIWYLLLDHLSMGRMLRIKMYSNVFIEYFTIICLGEASIFIFIGIMGFHNISPWTLFIFSCINILVLFSYKMTVYKTMKKLRGKGYNYRQIIIIADKESEYFVDRIIDTKDWGYKIRAIMTDSRTIINRYQNKFTIIPENEPLTNIIDKEVVDEVLFCKSNFNQDKIRSVINLCSEVGITFRIQSELLNIASTRSHISYVNQFPFLTFMNTPNNYLALKMKSLMDYIGAFMIITAISPILLFIAIAIKIDDGGSIFFKQTRVGKNGRLFQCIKFRTMVPNAEALKEKLMEQNEQEGPVFKMKNDPRVTRVGYFLRKTSLDELPQFLNVLKGEMSIVGPRPPLPNEVAEYERWQRRRLSMKPGITCIWQVSGRNNIPFDQWMKMDMQYIDSWSLKLDILLFFRTFKVMVIRDGQ